MRTWCVWRGGWNNTNSTPGWCLPQGEEGLYEFMLAISVLLESESN